MLRAHKLWPREAAEFRASVGTEGPEKNHCRPLSCERTANRWTAEALLGAGASHLARHGVVMRAANQAFSRRAGEIADDFVGQAIFGISLVPPFRETLKARSQLGTKS